MHRLVILSVLIPALSVLAIGGQPAPSTDPTPQAVTLGPGLRLREARPIPAEFRGPERAVRALRGREAKPLAMATADFDEDGVPDIVCGYRLGKEGLITQHRGNIDAIHPNAPEAQERRHKGTFTDAAFLPDARVFETSDAPDFLGAGDFDADGHWDVVVASRGKARLGWHRGDGKGGFGPSQAIDLPGNPTAFVTGEINRRDGLEDLVVAVDGPAGPEALIFEAPEGALQRSPERFGLPATATSLVLGQMDNEYASDLLIAAGEALVLVHGRDRLLSMTAPGKPVAQPAALTRVALPFRGTSLAVGRFSGTADLDVAILAESGAAHAVPIRSMLAASKQVTSVVDITGPSLKLDAPGGRLLTAKMSLAPGDDLLVLPLGLPVEVVPPSAAPPRPTMGEAGRGSGAPFSDRRPVDLRATEGTPVALLQMRLNADGRQDLVLLSSNPTVLSTYTPLDSMTIDVTNVDDSGPGSLRQAILTANSTPDSDLIRFAIGDPGPYIIRPVTPLPEITAPVTIDGSTQPGFAGTPLVTLDGALLTSCCIRFGLNDRGGGGNTFKALRVINFADAAIHVGRDAGDFGDWHIEGNHIGFDAAGDAAPNKVGIEYNSSGSLAGTVYVGGTTPEARNVVSGNKFGIGYGFECEVYDTTCLRRVVIQGNYIGTWPGGTVVVPVPEFSYGVTAGTPNSLVGGTAPGAGNVISGMTDDALYVTSPHATLRDTAILVQGNRFGTDPSGLTQLGNGRSVIVGSSINTVGGTTPAARNIIASKDDEASRSLSLSGRFNLVLGNYIGVGADGSTPFLGYVGVDLDGDSNDVGGTTPGSRNIISGHSRAGVTMGTGATLNTVAGNHIGTNAFGNAAVPNQRGVETFGGALDNIIGVASGGNVISGNLGFGVKLGGTGANVVTNNLIGLSAGGTNRLGNGFAGIHIENSDGNLIGSTDPANQNVIAYNIGSGISVSGSDATGNAILINAIFENTDLGIDLASDGVTLNDPQDTDSGENELQNYPELTLAQWDGETVRVDGTLQSKPSSGFTIRVYVSEACDPTGHGEGKFYLGSFTASTDASGLAAFSETFDGAAAIGEAVTTTASRLGNTSEFSACKAVVGVAPGVVRDVRFDSARPERLVWDAEPGASLYNLYIGTVSTIPGVLSPIADSCQAAAIPETGGTLPVGSNPPPGQMIWFMVTAANQFGEGELQPASSGPRILNSTGFCGDSCAHSTCSAGGPLVPACTLCTSIICAKDPHCCDPQNGSWDFACVQQMRTVCRSLTCGESEGQCPHSLCDAFGGPLPPGCDTPPLAVSCTAAVCQADPHCCQQAWDEACIAKMETVCGYSCI